MKAAIYLDREGRLFLATFGETTPSHWDDLTANGAVPLERERGCRDSGKVSFAPSGRIRSTTALALEGRLNVVRKTGPVRQHQT